MMGIPFITDIIGGVKDLVSEVVVDKDKKNEINYKLQELADRVEERIHEERLAQIEVNKAEANSGSLFVAGWRPGFGWAGVFVFIYTAVLYPTLIYFGGSGPELDTALTRDVIYGILGIAGTQRTIEKIKGVSTNNYTDTPAPKTDVVAAPVKKKKFRIF